MYRRLLTQTKQSSDMLFIRPERRKQENQWEETGESKAVQQYRQRESQAESIVKASTQKTPVIAKEEKQQRESDV